MRHRRSPNRIPISSRLRGVVKRLERWRRHRKPHSPIPEVLWSAAVQLAEEYGASRTARLLRLGYDSLKKRMEAEAGGRAESSARSAQKVSPTFVELVGPVTGSIRECTVELEQPGGAKMRLELKGVGAGELSALTNSFWSAAR